MTRYELKNCANSLGYRLVRIPAGMCECLIVRYGRRVGYNTGVYGWNWDAIVMDSLRVVVCHYYRNAAGETLVGIDGLDKQCRAVDRDDEELKREFSELLNCEKKL